MRYIESILKALLDIDFDEKDIFGTTKTETYEYVVPRHIEPPNRTYEITQKLSSRDDDFSADTMLAYAEKLFREVHKSVANLDLEPIKHLVSDRLYKVLEDLISDNKVDAIEEYSFDSEIEKNYLTSYKMDDKFVYEYMTVCLIMKMPSSDIKYINRLTFRRDVNKSQRIGSPIARAISCPNCGASLSSVTATKCEYCNSLITAAKYEWELLNFEIVKS